MFMQFVGNLNVSICTESICHAKISKLKYSLRYLQDVPNLYVLDSISLAMLVKVWTAIDIPTIHRYRNNEG